MGLGPVHNYSSQIVNYVLTYKVSAVMGMGKQGALENARILLIA